MLGLGGMASAVGAAPVPCVDTLYTGGTILTMAGGRIVHAGVLKSSPRCANTRVVSLQGRTLLPGFIDTRGHFIHFGKTLIDADLFGATTIEEILRRMQEQAQKMGPGEWTVGFGFRATTCRATRAWPCWMPA
jgi:predicted amidohydrolase YtcJ